MSGRLSILVTAKGMVPTGTAGKEQGVELS